MIVISMGMDPITLVMAEHMNRPLSIVIPIEKIARYALTIGEQQNMLLTDQEGQTTNLIHHITIGILIHDLFHDMTTIIGSSAEEAVIMIDLIHIVRTGKILDLAIISGVIIATV
jgi:hypothetical protein